MVRCVEFYPASANAVAQPRPMPLAPPVTRTDWLFGELLSIDFVKSIFDVTWKVPGSLADEDMMAV